MKRTDYFGRFENKAADAEDRLTRAFLVLLRLIPPVQAAFIDAIREKQREQGKGSVVPSRTATDVGLGGVWSQVGTLRIDEGGDSSAASQTTRHCWNCCPLRLLTACFLREGALASRTP